MLTRCSRKIPERSCHWIRTTWMFCDPCREEKSIRPGLNSSCLGGNWAPDIVADEKNGRFRECGII